MGLNENIFQQIERHLMFADLVSVTLLIKNIRPLIVKKCESVFIFPVYFVAQYISTNITTRHKSKFY